MRLRYSLALFALLSFCTAASSFAQAASSPVAVEQRGVIIGSGGISASSGVSGGAAGVTATFNLTGRLAIEGSGVFSMSHGGMDTQSATASLLINLSPARETERIVPYVAGGLGLYRAAFDMDEMGFGSFMSQYAGYSSMMSIPGGGFGMMQGGSITYIAGNPLFTPANMPNFYANRMGVLTPGNGRFGMRSFTDPAVSLGGGVQIRAGRHLVVRPDARVIVAIANGNERAVGVITMGLGYGF